MLKQATFLSVLVLALTALATPALAHEEGVPEVETVDIAFMPSAVAVKPGGTVVWNHPQTVEAHNVKFDDLTIPVGGPATPTPAPFTATRTFGAASPTPYRFYCEEHGAPGGVGMSGVVYVTADGHLPPGAPTASVTSPDSVGAGQSITFNAGGSSDVGGSIVKYEWDVDGDGHYEVDTAGTPTLTRAFPIGGTRVVRLRVTDNQGLTGESFRTVTVNEQTTTPPPPPPPPPPAPFRPIAPPVAAPTVQPPPPVSSKIRVLSSKRLRSVLRGLRFETGVPSNGASLRATLSLRGRTLGTLRRSSLSRGRVKLTLKLSRRGKASLKKQLAKRRRISTVMKVTAGNQAARAKVTISR